MNNPIQRKPPPFDIPSVFLTAFAIIAIVCVNRLGIPGNVLFFATLIVMIVHSPEWAFRAFSLCFLGLVTNQAIVLKTPVWTVARFLIPAMCLLRFTVDLQQLRQPMLRPRYLAALAMFIAVAAVLSVMTGYFVHIALLKLVNFGIGAFALLYGVRVIAARRTDLTPWFVAIVLSVVILGVASIPLGIGYNFRGDASVGRGLFNGAFYHSNCLGPMCALMTTFMACVVVFGPYRNRWLCVVLASCLVYFMALTQSRTSFGALVVGLLTLVTASMVLKRRQIFRLNMRVARATLIGGLIAVAVVGFAYDVASGQKLTKSLIVFAQKGKQAETLSVEDVLASRQGIVDSMWANFLESPWIGIGFEVAKSQYFQQTATLFNAPIEKGFMPMAVLEETGLIGTFFFVVFIAALIASLAKRLNAPGLALLFAFLAVNCGESMFFSLGGHGAFGWLMMVAGIMLGEHCVVRQSPHVPRPVEMPQVSAQLYGLQPRFGN
jgi:O-antigen ligase